MLNLPLAFALLLVACSSHRDAPAPATPPDAPQEEAAEEEEATEAPSDDVPSMDEGEERVPASAAQRSSAQELYEGCLRRVEGPSTEGECKTDADCGRAGCSREVCVAVETVPEIMTTCEVLPCFQALDRCTCQDGVCTWTLKESVEGLPKLPISPP